MKGISNSMLSSLLIWKGVNVKQVSQVALKTRDLEQQSNFYTNIVGLGETQRDSSGRVYLRCNANHHAVVLIPSAESGIDHYALDVGVKRNSRQRLRRWLARGLLMRRKDQLSLARGHPYACVILTAMSSS